MTKRGVYASRVAAGRCGSCGRSRLGQKGRCKPCRAMTRKHQAKKQAAGLCLENGCHETPAPGRNYCPKHAARRAETTKVRTKILRAGRKEAGLCGTLGCTNKAEPDKFYCPVHKVSNAAHVRAWRARRKASARQRSVHDP